MRLTLVRHAYLPARTLGRLHADGLTLCTLEEPWISDLDGPGGQRREHGFLESCVPDGVYNLVPHSGRIKDVWCLVNPALGVYRWPQDIPAGQKWGRAAILIHAGTTVDSTLGCILVGMAFLNYERLHESAIALGKLRSVLGLTGNHQLEIRPTAGTKES